MCAGCAETGFCAPKNVVRLLRDDCREARLDYEWERESASERERFDTKSQELGFCKYDDDEPNQLISRCERSFCPLSVD